MPATIRRDEQPAVFVALPEDEHVERSQPRPLGLAGWITALALAAWIVYSALSWLLHDGVPLR